MDFSTLVNDKIMPEVKSGSDEPIIIYRDRHGDWHGDHTLNQFGDEFDWVEDVREDNAFAITVKGSDFNDKNFPAVYDTIFLEKIRNEYDYFYDYGNAGEHYSLLSFIEDNIGDFPSEVTDYLIDLERPFAAIDEMLPHFLKADITGNFYDESVIDNIIGHLEREIETKTNNRNHNNNRDDNKETHDIDGYDEILGLRIGGKYIMFAENKKEPGLYLVCNITNNHSAGLEERNDIVNTGYLDGLREFTARVDTTIENLKHERHENGLPLITLTADNCIPDTENWDLEDLLIIIKPEALSPEYRSAEYQLQYCKGGNGAKPDSRGSAVFCKNFHSDKESRFERCDVLGVADKFNLPAWADKKIKMKESMGNFGAFEFGEYHFTAYENELFKHNEPPQKTKEKKPSLSERIEEGKKKVRETDKNKDKTDKPKKYNKGVDD